MKMFCGGVIKLVMFWLLASHNYVKKQRWPGISQNARATFVGDENVNRRFSLIRDFFKLNQRLTRTFTLKEVGKVFPLSGRGCVSSQDEEVSVRRGAGAGAGVSFFRYIFFAFFRSFFKFLFYVFISFLFLSLNSDFSRFTSAVHHFWHYLLREANSFPRA